MAYRFENVLRRLFDAPFSSDVDRVCRLWRFQMAPQVVHATGGAQAFPACFTACREPEERIEQRVVDVRGDTEERSLDE